MEIWKNRELRREIVLYILGTMVATMIAKRMCTKAIPFVVLLGGVFIGINMFFQYKRYQSIANLSNCIDHILHGQKQQMITDSREGELSILTSEISKMTVRLSEQANLLKKEKGKLTDAIADISHQMRTPLTTMNLLLSMLTAEELSMERRLQLTRELKRQIEKVHWLVESLLKMSKIDAGTVQFAEEDVSVAELLKSAVEPFLVPMELKGQQYRVSVLEERAKVDRGWTQEALANLIKNCVEHTKEDGIIEVSVCENELYTQIILSDNGEGFCEEDLPHIFERFYKGKNATKESIGIGLSLSKMIILAQNGTITADNKKDGGARFKVRFYKSIV